MSGKIACCCVTWNRPIDLGQLIQCFVQQDYANRYLTILDDAGQYPDQPHGDRWQVVSFRRRFRTIGEKRAACVGLTPPDADMLAVWDDDDIYLPGALSACVAALQRAPWAQARVVLEWDRDDLGRALPGWHNQETFNQRDSFRCAYHSAWSFTRAAYVAIGGYRPEANEDWPLAEALLRRFGPSADSTLDGRPWMVYSRGPSHLSSRYQALLSSEGQGRYLRAWAEKGQEAGQITPVDLYPLIGWDRWYPGISIPGGEPRAREW